MSAYLQLKGQEANLKSKRTAIILAASSLMKDLREDVAKTLITPLEDIDVDSIKYKVDELKKKKEEYEQVSGDLRKIRKELGEE